LSLEDLKRKSSVALSWDLLGLIASKGSSFIISIFLARLLSPEEFGLVGMASVFIVVFQVFGDVGFSTALIQKKDIDNLAYDSVFYFNVFGGGLLFILFYFISPFIGDFYNRPEVVSIIRWLSISFLLNSLNQVQTALLTKKLNFKVLTIRNIASTLFGGILGVIAALNHYGVYALVIQSLASTLMRTILLWSISTWKPSWRFSRKELMGLTNFSLYVFFDRLISTIFRKLDVILVAKIFSASSLGFYSRAVSLKDQVTTYSSTSIQKVFFPVLSSIQDDKERFESVYYKVLSVVLFLTFLLSGILFVLGEEIIINLFGEKWSPSVPLFEVLILGVCVYPLNAMMINALMSQGFSKENFKVGLIRKAIQLAPLAIAYYYGLYLFTVSYVCASYLATFVNIYFLEKYAGFSIKKHILKLTHHGLLLILLVLFVHYFGINNGTAKFVLTLIYVILYYSYHKIFKSEGLLFLEQNVMDKLIKRK